MTAALTPAHAFKVGFGFWEAKALLSAVELGLFTELAKGPADLATLSKQFGLHQRAPRNFLDALVALKLLERQDATAIRQTQICFSTRPNQAMSAVCLKWPMPGFITRGAL